MNETDFNQAVKELLEERAECKLQALDLGRRFNELCTEYLKTHGSLPPGFEEFSP